MQGALLAVNLDNARFSLTVVRGRFAAQKMRIALIAMPWAWIDLPSLALGTLAPTLRREEPDWQVVCFNEYVHLFEQLGEGYRLLSANTRMGQLLYGLLLHPERKSLFQQRWVQWLQKVPLRLIHFFGVKGSLEHTLDLLDRHLEQLAGRLSDFDVVGLTTTFDQLLPSIALARRLRERGSHAQVVLGGAAVEHESGPSVLRAYHDCIDTIIQGDGEDRLLHLLRGIAAGQAATTVDGILTIRKETVSTPQDILANTNLDSLPDPDFDDYADLARRNGIMWDIPIEASRGCWWHRVEQTGNVTDSCFFCGLNSTSYREKSAGRVAAEMQRQAERYKGARFRFVDNVVRHKNAAQFAREIHLHGRSLFFELRANISPHAIYELWRAGCDHVQIGVEGLCSSYLRRLGKGTTVIQNLQAMKVCFELRVLAVSNLIVGFPGATPAEVAETARNIRDFASAYEPLQITPFRLCAGSAVHRLPDRFGITNIRVEDDFALVIPEKTMERLCLPWLQYDLVGEAVDWQPVVAAAKHWRTLHERPIEFDSLWSIEGLPLYYNDGGSFLEIVDQRETPTRHVLDEIGRELYLFCSEIRTRTAIERHFAGRVPAAKLADLLTTWSANKLLFSEGTKVLALAPARRPDLAAARIEASQQPP